LNCFVTDITLRTAENSNTCSGLTNRDRKRGESGGNCGRLGDQFYRVQVGAIESQELEQGQYHIGFSVFRTRLKDQSNGCLLSFFCPTGMVVEPKFCGAVLELTLPEKCAKPDFIGESLRPRPAQLSNRRNRFRAAPTARGTRCEGSLPHHSFRKFPSKSSNRAETG
jgi:hypothetical protein